MPFPQGSVTSQFGNRLIYVERDYDKAKLHDKFENIFCSLTSQLIYY